MYLNTFKPISNISFKGERYMLEYITEIVNMFFMQYGALGVFIGTVIEEIIAPIPSTLIIIGSSFFMLDSAPLTLESFFKLIFYIAVPVGLGMTIGSTIVYALCYYLGKPFVEKYGRFLGLRWEDIDRFNRKISNQKRDYAYIYAARAVPVIPSVAISGFCGVVRYDLKKYLILTFLGGITRAFILGFIGWQFGSYYRTISMQLSNIEEILVVLIAIAIVGYIIYKRRKGVSR